MVEYKYNFLFFDKKEEKHFAFELYKCDQCHNQISDWGLMYWCFSRSDFKQVILCPICNTNINKKSHMDYYSAIHKIPFIYSKDKRTNVIAIKPSRPNLVTSNLSNAEMVYVDSEMVIDNAPVSKTNSMWDDGAMLNKEKAENRIGYLDSGIETDEDLRKFKKKTLDSKITYDDPNLLDYDSDEP